MQNLQFGLVMWAAFMACTAVDSLTGKKSKKAASTTGSSSSSPSSTTKVTTTLFTSSGSGKTIRQLLAKALPASQ
jgi:type III secretory pathway component EscT